MKSYPACILLPLTALLWYLAVPHAHPLLTHDSPGYVYFSDGRPVGYPAMVWMIHALTSTYRAIPAVQAALFCVSAALLGTAACRLLGVWPAIVLQALILMQPGPLREADQLLADAPSTAATMLFTAAVLAHAARPSFMRFAAAAATAGLALTLRPDNIALFAGLFVLCAGQSRKMMLTGFVLITACAITPTTQYLRHKSSEHTPFLIQKALLLPHRPLITDVPDLRWIEAQAAPLRTYIAAAPPEFQSYLRLRIGAVLRYAVIGPGLALQHGFTRTQQAAPILNAYTRAQISAGPASFINGALDGYVDLVLNHTFVDAAWVNSYNAYVAANPPPWPVMAPEPAGDTAPWQQLVAETGTRPGVIAYLSQSQDGYLAPPPARLRWAILVTDGIQLLACGVAWLVIMIWVFSWRSSGEKLRAVAALSVVLQVHLLVAGFMEFALPRYVFTVWPVMIAILVMSADLARANRQKFFASFFQERRTSFLLTPAKSPQPEPHPLAD